MYVLILLCLSAKASLFLPIPSHGCGLSLPIKKGVAHAYPMFQRQTYQIIWCIYIYIIYIYVCHQNLNPVVSQ